MFPSYHALSYSFHACRVPFPNTRPCVLTARVAPTATVDRKHRPCKLKPHTRLRLAFNHNSLLGPSCLPGGASLPFLFLTQPAPTFRLLSPSIRCLFRNLLPFPIAIFQARVASHHRPIPSLLKSCLSRPFQPCFSSGTLASPPSPASPPIPRDHPENPAEESPPNPPH